MDLQYVKKLVRLVENSGVNEIEVEEQGIKIRVAKHGQNNASFSNVPSAAQFFPVPSPPNQGPGAAAVQEKTPPAKPESKYHEIKSPIVGTFYRAPAPDADPYVEVGQEIQPGTVLCIIEAMKLMNEIESDIAGKIIKIMIDNGQPVEYNQPIFLIEPM